MFTFALLLTLNNVTINDILCKILRSKFHHFTMDNNPIFQRISKVYRDYYLDQGQWRFFEYSRTGFLLPLVISCLEKKNLQKKKKFRATNFSELIRVKDRVYATYLYLQYHILIYFLSK